MVLKGPLISFPSLKKWPPSFFQLEEDRKKVVMGEEMGFLGVSAEDKDVQSVQLWMTVAAFA